MIKKIIVVLISIFTIIGCVTKSSVLIPTNNIGGYTIEFKENKNLKGLYIHGKVLDVRTKKALPAKITIGCSEADTSKEGYYFFEFPPVLSPEDRFNLEGNFFEAYSLGYRIVETRPISFYQKDTLNINFYLEEDLRPLIQCEEINVPKENK